MILNIFSGANLPPTLPPWRSLSSNTLPNFLHWVLRVLFIFWIQVLYQIRHLQRFSPSQCLFFFIFLTVPVNIFLINNLNFFNVICLLQKCEQTLGDSKGQGNLVCCSPWVTKSQTWVSNWRTTTICLTTDAHLRMEKQRNIKYMHI